MTVLSGSHPSAPTVCDGSVTRRSATPLMEVFSSSALRRSRSMSCSTTCCDRGRAKRTQLSVTVSCSGFLLVGGSSDETYAPSGSRRAPAADKMGSKVSRAKGDMPSLSDVILSRAG